MFELDRFLRLSTVDESLEVLFELNIVIESRSIVEDRIERSFALDHCSKVDRECDSVRPRCKGLGAL